ncbi:unnamed protein product [Lampetra planeri]
MLNWSEEEALKVLPTIINDDTLQVNDAYLRRIRRPPAAYREMAKIYDPPFSANHKLQSRQRREGESPLAYRSTLLTLAQAAFPQLDRLSLDSLVTERLLTLVWDLGIVLPVAEE